MTTPDNSATEKPTIAERLRDKIATVQQFEQACGQTLSINVTIDEAVHAATELERLRSANEKLRGECERLPAYADTGMPMLWGDEVWIGPGETHVGGVKDVYPNGIELQRDSGIVYFPSSRCFSTREAAARAAEGGD